MSEVDCSIRFAWADGIWIGYLPSPWGVLGVIVSGTKEAPRPAHLSALEQFLPRAGVVIPKLRARIAFSFLYRPIRIAINEQNRVGVQFRNRITGSQTVMHFADEV